MLGAAGCSASGEQSPRPVSAGAAAWSSPSLSPASAGDVEGAASTEVGSASAVVSSASDVVASLVA
ncbi:hypothetical protein [Corynebacterium kefirresidentii]|uniref:hypothetical protein n=1 Tax=Corynebacterium kefirresidentii TaxID=1979527 RepID=UPI001FC9E2E1|nr:hypothetical protein [Corynebacterium kefirresidentii]